MSAPPKAYLFDVFGTIVDWRSGVASVAARVFQKKEIDTDPYEFADAWRGKYQPAMERIRSGGRGYVSLDQLHRENLDEILDDFRIGSHFSEGERSNFNHAWEQLPPWPDSVPGLQKIKARAVIAPCSNGSIALMTRLARFGLLPWDCILGAEIAQNYKPEPDAYLKSVEALALEPHEVVMVAAHNSDLAAAQACGLKTAFIPRPLEMGPGQKEDLKPTGKWDYIIDNIGELST